MSADPRARWAEWLRAPADAPAEVAAAAFLRTLPGDGFLPPAERVAAANALAGTSAPTGRDADVERLLRDEVDAFAVGYWALAPADRLTAWADLSRRGAAPARLRELEPGLDVPAVALADPAAEELAALVRVLFVLRPRERAIRRNTWLLEQTPAVEKWRAALAVVQRDAPALAALEPHLRVVLAPAFDRALTAFVDGASVAPTTHHVITVGAARAREREYEVETKYEDADSARAKKILWGGPLLTIGMIMFCCTLSGISKRSNRESAVDAPRSVYTPPGAADRPAYFPPATYEPSVRTFTPANVAEFDRYEQERAIGIESKRPLGYADWVRAGSPRGTLGATPPAPERPSYSFDRGLIKACRDYERGETRSKPVLYDRWVAAGKPTVPGAYPLINPNP